MDTHLPSSVILSLALHAVVGSVVGTAFVSCTAPIDSRAKLEQAEAIEATVLTEKEAMAYYEHKRAQAEERRRIVAQQKAAEQKRKELERKRKAQQVELQRRKEVEKKRKAEQLRLEKQRAAERKAKQEAEEEEQRKAKEREKALQEARKREQERRAEEEARRQAELKRLKAEHQEQLRMRKRQLSQWTKQYVNTLRRSVETQWKKPPKSIKGGDCIVRVRQQTDGVVVDVRIISCDGDKLYRSSVVEAVWKANPLPLPPVEDVFDSEIELTFRKEYGG